MMVVKYKIKGMTCNDCARHIENLFDNKDGIINRKVSFTEGIGEFTYDPDKIQKAEIIKTIHTTPHYRIISEIDDKKENQDIEESNEINSKPANYYDIIIIGGGSAAFSAAITAQEKGKKILIVNAGLPIGGTCVNVGCVPSKNLIRIADDVHRASESHFEGIITHKPEFNFQTLLDDNQLLVKTLRQKKYIDVIKNKKEITQITGWAVFINKNTIEVEGKQYISSRFILATGASTNIPSIKGIEKVPYLTNKTLFQLKEQPQSITILGAGYIGLEIAMAFNRLGTKVTILEFTDRVLRTQTEDISNEITKFMKKEGINLLPNHRIEEITQQKDVFILKGTNKITGKSFTINEEGKIFVATGIKANTSSMGLEKTGIRLNKNGSIIVNERQETNIPGIYAAGDCTNTPAFVYTAAAEGKTAALNAIGENNAKTDYTGLPWVVFTDPQVAGAGIDEIQAEKKEIPYETAIIKLSDVPRAIAANDTRGFIKLIRNPNTDALLGIRVVAPEGGEIVMQASLAIKYGISVTDLANSLFPYLTLSEGIKLAAITFHKSVNELSCCAV